MKKMILGIILGAMTTGAIISASAATRYPFTSLGWSYDTPEAAIKELAKQMKQAQCDIKWLKNEIDKLKK